jgi:hypothetical protein
MEQAFILLSSIQCRSFTSIPRDRPGPTLPDLGPAACRALSLRGSVCSPPRVRLLSRSYGESWLLPGLLRPPCASSDRPCLMSAVLWVGALPRSASAGFSYAGRFSDWDPARSSPDRIEVGTGARSPGCQPGLGDLPLVLLRRGAPQALGSGGGLASSDLLDATRAHGTLPCG